MSDYEVTTEAPPSAGGLPAWIPLAVGAGALVFALVAIYFAVSAQGELATVKAKLAAQDNAPIMLKLAELEAKQGDLDGRLLSAGSAAARAEAGLRSLGNDTQRLFNEVGARFQKTDEVVTAANEAIKVLQGARAGVSRAATTAAGAGTGSGGPSPAPVTAAGGQHTVASGDNFSKLAQRYGVTVVAIQRANPGVDSSRLQIGQVLTIPPKP